jgi:hypothetical protein
MKIVFISKNIRDGTGCFDVHPLRLSVPHLFVPPLHHRSLLQVRHLRGRRTEIAKSKETRGNKPDRDQPDFVQG